MKKFIENTPNLIVKNGNRFDGFDLIDGNGSGSGSGSGKGLRFDQNGSFVGFLGNDP